VRAHHLKLEALEYAIPGSRIRLGPIDLTLAPADCIAIVGHSGVGKTTFLDLIAGFRRPSDASSTIQVDGRLWAGPHGFGESKRARYAFSYPWERGVGLVFQKGAGLQPERTVRENLQFALGGFLSREMTEADWTRLVDTYWLRESEERALGRGPKPIDFLDRKVEHLSGGQKTRVAIARGLVRTDRAIYLLDEPLEGQDNPLRQDLLGVLQERIRRAKDSRQRTAFILVTHDQAEALAVADRLVYLERGEDQRVVIRAEGSPRQLIEVPPNLSVARFLGDPPMNFLNGEVDDQGRLWIGRRRTQLVAVGEARCSVVVGVRPSDLEFIKATNSEGYLYRAGAEVVQVRFRGTDWVYTLRPKGEAESLLAEGRNGILLLQSHEDLDLTTFEIGVPLERVHVFEVGNGMRLPVKEIA